eukprot:5488413-Pyramimonas_sp.AAC.1
MCIRDRRRVARKIEIILKYSHVQFGRIQIGPPISEQRSGRHQQTEQRGGGTATRSRGRLS